MICLEVLSNVFGDWETADSNYFKEKCAPQHANWGNNLRYKNLYTSFNSK